MRLDVEIQKFLFLFFGHFLQDNHFKNAPEEGVNPQIFISTLQILIIWAPNIQKDVCSFILIWWVWMTGLPIASGLCQKILFSRIFTRDNFSPYICLYLKNVPHINLNWMKISRVQFSNSHWLLFVVTSIKFSSVVNFTFPPTPKSLFFRNHVSYTRQLCGLALW